MSTAPETSAAMTWRARRPAARTAAVRSSRCIHPFEKAAPLCIQAAAAGPCVHIASRVPRCDGGVLRLPREPQWRRLHVRDGRPACGCAPRRSERRRDAAHRLTAWAHARLASARVLLLHLLGTCLSARGDTHRGWDRATGRAATTASAARASPPQARRFHRLWPPRLRSHTRSVMCQGIT